MSKISFAALSLIGAIPGAVLSVMLVMALVGHFSDMVGTMRVITVLILLVSALMTVMPVGILLFIKEEKPATRTAVKEDDEDAVEDVPTEDSMGRQELEPELTATDAFAESDDGFDEEPEPEPEPKGRKKKKKKK